MTAAKPKSGPNWEELPKELTVAILSRADDFDVLRSAQFVCSSWHNVCRDPLRWRTIELRILGRLNLRSKFDYAFVTALDYSSGQVSDITIDGFCSDYILSSIANRQNQIKCLRLHGVRYVTEKAMCDAIEKLPLLEELEVSGGSFGAACLSSLKDNCPRLESLMFRCRNNVTSYSTESVFNTQANAIAKCLPGLRRLDIAGNFLSDSGLRAILDGCPNLESLDLRSCSNLQMQGDLRKRCKEKIKHLLLPEDGNLPINENPPLLYNPIMYDDDDDEVEDDDIDDDDDYYSDELEGEYDSIDEDNEDGNDDDDDDDDDDDGDEASIREVSSECDDVESEINEDDDNDDDHDDDGDEASIREEESSECDDVESEINEDDEFSDGFGDESFESVEDGISEGGDSDEDELSDGDNAIENEFSEGIDGGVEEFSEVIDGGVDEFSEGIDGGVGEFSEIDYDYDVEVFEDNDNDYDNYDFDDDCSWDDEF